MRIYTLSKRDASNIVDKMNKEWPFSLDFGKTTKLKIVEIDESNNLLFFPDLEAIKLDDLIIPLLKREEILRNFPFVEVDQGAVPHICNGADVMRPGIVGWGPFKRNDIMGIRENNYKKFIAVGIALVDQSDIEKMKKGTIVKNLHYVGDKFWQAYKQIQI